MRDVEWKEGQTVCVVYSRQRGTPLIEEATIPKIGRKWATLNRGSWKEVRFDMETGFIDGGNGGYSPGRVYTDRTVYEEQTRRDEAWSSLRLLLQGMPWAVPKHMTVERMQRVRAILCPDTSPAPRHE